MFTPGRQYFQMVNCLHLIYRWYFVYDLSLIFCLYLYWCCYLMLSWNLILSYINVLVQSVRLWFQHTFRNIQGIWTQNQPMFMISKLSNTSLKTWNMVMAYLWDHRLKPRRRLKLEPTRNDFAMTVILLGHILLDKFTCKLKRKLNVYD